MSYFQQGKVGSADGIPLVSPRVVGNLPKLKSDGSLEDSGIGYDDILGYHYIMGIYKDWSQSSPIWNYCDCDGSPITPPSGWQATNPILKNMKTCVVTPEGAVTFGTNNRGDGLDLTGASGQVMVRVPAVYMDRWWEGETEFIVFSPSPCVTPGGRSLILNPAFYQRGGWARSALYVSRYYAGLAVKSTGALYALSATAKQPWTGGEMVELSFTNGNQAPSVGDILTGATSGVRGTVVAVYLQSGSWGSGDAAGKIYLKAVDERLSFNTGSGAFTVGQTVTGASSGATGIIIAVVVTSGSWGGGDAAGYLVIRGGNGYNYTISPSENITDPLGGLAKATGDGSAKAPFTSAENLQMSGVTIMKAASVGSALALTCQNLSDYAKAYAGGDTRWGCINVFTNDLLTMLAYFDLGTCDIQSLTSVGSGVTTKPWTRNFGGVLNGADSVDSNVDTNGTGKGTGAAGQTPNMWRGLQDFLGGNIWGFVIGLQGNTGGVWNIINPNGLSIPQSPLAAGSFISTVGACLSSDGYWGKSLNEAAAKWLLLPSDVTGSSVTKRCDYYYYPRYAQTGLLVGGRWIDGANAGVGCRSASGAASNSARTIGGRLEYLP